MNDIRSLGNSLKAERKRISAADVDAMHAALLAHPEALDYCIKVRRWDEAVVRRFKIGLRADQRGKWLAFPWWRAGECVGMKYRILPAYQDRYPQRFDREPGCESVLFNVDALAGHDEILLASGESDALALVTLGFENVVATTTGEGSLPASAVDALAKKARVLIPFDNDAAGQKGAREIGKRIGFDRAWLVPLPVGLKDVNEFLVNGGTHEAFKGLLANAIQFDIPSISNLSQALDRLEEEKTVGSWDQMADMTPWSLVNRRLGHWRPGNLIVLSGPQGTGKTTWGLNVAMFWAAQRFPALVYCLEMTVEELVQHVLCAHYQLTEEQITTQVIARARQELGDWPLFLGANPRVTGRKEVLDLLGQAVRRYGLRLLIFDNLHMLARSIEHRTEEIGVITKTFKMFAMEHEVPVVMIAQPRKLQPGQVMTPWDLKDSVDIFSDADQVILLHRELIGASRDREAVAAAEAGNEENFSPLTLVRLAKARHRASRDAVLYLVGGEHRFRDIGPGDLPEQKPIPRRGRERLSGLTDEASHE
jgi:archaellum biogenesis ATPase FlaH